MLALAHNDRPRKNNDWKLQYLENEKPHRILSSKYIIIIYSSDGTATTY